MFGLMIRPPGYSVRTWIEIDKRSLFFNYEYFRKLAGVPVMAVVKSNAYGHGLVQVSKALSGLPRFQRDGWFGVDSIVEALALRREGIRSPILVLGHTLASRYADAARQGITLTISSFDGLRFLTRARQKPAFHIKLDTGMHRQGFQSRELPELIRQLRRHRLEPQGAYSHFAAAENQTASAAQYRIFRQCLRAFSGAGSPLPLTHMAATGAMFLHRAPGCSMVRLGLGLYGYLPNGRRGLLRPVATWKTLVGELKTIAKGEYIGYDRTERLRRKTIIAILPIGYWHGFDRGLSSIGRVLIRGRSAKVLGRVSMDMVVVDVTNIPGVRMGDEAVLIGRQGKDFIGADEVAAKIGTTAYEILTRVNPLIRRILQ